MPETETIFNEQLENLRRTRDELRLQIHLGADEAREEWERAEAIWVRFEGEVQRFSSMAERPQKQLKEAAIALGHEIGVAYGRIRTALQRES